MGQGCCVDRSCTPETCMELPAGKTCGDCIHHERCCVMYGHVPDDNYCDFFPRRFKETPSADLRGVGQVSVPPRGDLANTRTLTGPVAERERRKDADRRALEEQVCRGVDDGFLRGLVAEGGLVRVLNELHGLIVQVRQSRVVEAKRRAGVMP